MRGEYIYSVKDYAMSITVSHDRTAQGDIQGLPLSPAQKELWTLHQLKPDSPLHTLSASVHIQLPLNIQWFEYGLNALIQRHEALRTTFQERDGQPSQIISACLPISLSVVDLRALSG